VPVVNFVNRALSALDALYNIVGGESRIDRLALTPLTLVHDVSRETEATAGFPALLGPIATTAGAGVAAYVSTTLAEILATADVVQELNARGLSAAQVNVWVLGYDGVATTASIGNLGGVSAGIQFGNLGLPSVMLLDVWNLAGTPIEATEVSTFLRNANNIFAARMHLPFLLPPHVDSALLVRAQDDAGGVLVAGVAFYLWICPKGTFPPGA